MLHSEACGGREGVELQRSIEGATPAHTYLVAHSRHDAFSKGGVPWMRANPEPAELMNIMAEGMLHGVSARFLAGACVCNATANATAAAYQSPRV